MALNQITTAVIADDAVTYAKIQDVSATDKLLGRETAGAGVVEEIACTSFARTLLDDADAATARATLGVSASTWQYGNLLHVKDEKTAGTAAQTLSAATWDKRDLNTVVVNNISGSTVVSSVITLPAGSYFFEARCPASAAGDHKGRLRDTTNTATVGVGNGMSDTVDSSSPSIVSDYFTIAGSANFELQHYTTGGGAGGVAVNGAEVEVYSEIWIWKVA